MRTTTLPGPIPALLLSLALAALAPPALAQWKTTDLGTLGGALSRPTAINGAGQVAGYSEVGGQVGVTHAFLADGAGARDLGTLGGIFSTATAINASGQVTGISWLPDSNSNSLTHAYRYGAGAMTDLGTLGGSYSYPKAINASGQVAGVSNLSGPGGPYHAFVTGAAGMRDLGTLGGLYSEAAALNAAGQVAGFSDLAAGAAKTPQHGFLSSGVGMVDIGTLGGSFSRASALNERGVAVGSSTLAGDAATHAIVYQNGALRDLGTLGGAFSAATGINDAGQIIGHSWLPGDALEHAFLLNPGGQMQDLGTLGGAWSYAAEINARGEVVGFGPGPEPDPGADSNPFLYKDGAMLAIDSLVRGFHDLDPVVHLNDAGQIIGSGVSDLNGEIHAFLLTPLSAVPEAPPPAMLLAGLAGLALLTRLRAGGAGGLVLYCGNRIPTRKRSRPCCKFAEARNAESPTTAGSIRATHFPSPTIKTPSRAASARSW